MITTNIWIENNKIKIKTNDPSIRYLLEVTKKEQGYIPFRKKWGIQTTTYKIYDDKRVKADHFGYFNFTLGLGWVGYILATFSNHISADEYNALISSLYSKTYRDTPFPNLRDFQNEDVLYLLKYKRGLLSCYTSYGKTEVISTLANYAYSLGKRVLMIAPGTAALEELIKRCKSKFNLDVPNKDLSLNAMITTGLLNRKDTKDAQKIEAFDKLLASYDWVLVDEVEYCMNPGGFYILDRCINAECMYSFSGTAEKETGQMISFRNGLKSDSVINSRHLIKYFGPSLIYKVPLNIDIDYIYVKTRALDNLTLKSSSIDKNIDEDADSPSNIYLDLMNEIWTNEGIINSIENIINRFPNIFIPINNLTTILSSWINNYFLKKYRILLVCGEGFFYYDLNGNKYSKTLTECCELIKNKQTDVILSTSSGYRALDFPGLEHILLIQGKKAGVVLQCIGRVARGKHMNIISLLPTNDKKKIPIYSKGQEHRDNLIKNYYKYCNSRESVILEETL